MHSPNRPAYNDALTLAGAKWHNLVASHTNDEAQRHLLSLLLESQDKAFKNGPSPLVRLAGGTTPALEALAAAFVESPLWRMVSIQPMMGAVSPVVNFQTASSSDPSIALLTQTITTVVTDLCSCTRTLVRFRQGDDLRRVFERGLVRIAREVLGEIRESAATTIQVPGITAGDLDENLTRASNTVFKLGQRSPATWLVTGPGMFELLKGPKFVPAESLLEDIARAATDDPDDRVYYAGTYLRRWHVIVDTKFPQREILLGRMGAATADASFIYAPFYFTTHDIAESDENMLVARHAFLLVKPGDFARLTG